MKLIAKYKCYLNRYYNFPVSISSVSSSSSGASTASSNSTSSSATTNICISGTHVFSQYKAIIFGIVILLLIELLQIPYLYNCYSSYSLHVVYLIALLVQLMYLLLNAFIWIILTLKNKWKLNFTLKFQILLWHTLFYNYLNEYYGGVNSTECGVHTSTAKNEKVDVDNQNLQVKMLLMRKQQQIPKSFVNVISITNDKLNKMDKNQMICDENNCEENLVNNLSLCNDNRSECSTATTLLSQNTNFRAKLTGCNQSSLNYAVNKQHQQHLHHIANNPAIIKKIAQMNRQKKIVQVDPRQRNEHSLWNEFIVNENN